MSRSRRSAVSLLEIPGEIHETAASGELRAGGTGGNWAGQDWAPGGCLCPSPASGLCRWEKSPSDCRKNGVMLGKEGRKPGRELIRLIGVILAAMRVLIDGLEDSGILGPDCSGASRDHSAGGLLTFW